ncbi:hypothetical protein FSP39_006336 [Pinctada imbricata]|uniref:F-box domain-containing protein n=1 Tax=Pinctada imbricata TaxID=66713 RepID=A0AA88XYH1_PINIB|nr:hypothetical protein FSP39_006336 [Pinctada imbricata]
MDRERVDLTQETRERRGSPTRLGCDTYTKTPNLNNQLRKQVRPAQQETQLLQGRPVKNRLKDDNKSLDTKPARPMDNRCRLRIVICHIKAPVTTRRACFKVVRVCGGYARYVFLKTQGRKWQEYGRSASRTHMAASTKTSWGELPEYVVATILSYLNVKDRLNAAQVCKLWSLAAQHPIVWTSMTFNINKGRGGT